MLRQLRSRKTMKRVLRVTLFLIIPSFVMFYGWSQLSGKGGQDGEDYEYAKIKPKNSVIPKKWTQINKSDMKMANDQVRGEYEAMISSQIRDRRQMPDLREMVTPHQNIQRALENYIIEKYAQEKKITVPIEEIKSLIESMFPENTQEYFKKYLEYTRQSEDYFLYTQKENMKLAKAKLQIQSRAMVSLFECWLSYVELKEKLKVSYAVLPANKFIDKIQVDEKELETFFNENIKNYRVPDKVNFEYIAYTLNSIAETINVSDQDIQKYYDENRETQFKTPKEVNGRHIMIRIPKDANSLTLDEKKKKIDDIYKEVKQNKNFSEIADKYSEDDANTRITPPEEKNKEPKIEKMGGKFGPITEGGFSPFGEDFVTTVTKLAEGTITEPVKSNTGWHIIKIEDVKPATYESFEVVKDRIISALKNQKASEILNQKQEELKKISGDYTTISSLAKEVNLEVKETGLIDASSTFLGPDIQNISENKEYIDELPKNEMSEVLKNFNAVFILSKKESIPSHDPEINEVKDNVIADYKMSKAIEIAKTEAEKISKDAKNSDDLKKISEENGLQFATTSEYFTRLEMPKDFPSIKNFARATLNTPKDKVNVSETFPQSGGDKTDGYAVWIITEKVEPSLDEFKTELPKIQDELMSMKRETLYREFLKNQLTEYNYIINPNFISQ